TISFAAQQLAGRYTVKIGPDVQDTAGNYMNQDGDGANREATVDVFTGYVRRESPAAATMTFTEGFEANGVDGLAGYWSFALDTGTIEVSTSDGPAHGGSKHLRMVNP